MVAPLCTADRSRVVLAGTVRSLTKIEEQEPTMDLMVAASYVLIVQAGSVTVGNLREHLSLVEGNDYWTRTTYEAPDLP